MADLLAASGRQESGEELAEQVAELLLSVGREPSPDRSAWRRRRRGGRSSGAGGSDASDGGRAWGLSG